MIQLDALKEQLRLLGHSLPDDQIFGILADMGIALDAGGGAPGELTLVLLSSATLAWVNVESRC